MKGTFFQKPLEFNLHVDGESWRQGDPIHGTLTVKNHGNSEIPLQGSRVLLTFGEINKVRKKDPGAFKPLSSAAMEKSGPLAPGKSESFQWKFETDRCFPITHKTGSSFLLYGQDEAVEKLGQLQLAFSPHILIEEFLDILRIGFRFVIKSQKSNKGFVEVKLDPSDSRTLAAIEQVALQIRFQGEKLELRFLVDVKKLDATVGSIAMKMQKREFEQVFTPLEYIGTLGHIHHDRMEAAVRDVLGQLAGLNP